MVTSAPSLRQKSSFSEVPAVAMTLAPATRASCTAADPIPPAAAWIKTVSPAASFSLSNRASQDK